MKVDDFIQKNLPPTAPLSGFDMTSFDPFKGDVFTARSFDAAALILEGKDYTRKTNKEREVNDRCNAFAQESLEGTRVTAVSGPGSFWMPFQTMTRDANLPSVTLAEGVGLNADGGYLVEQTVSQGLTDALRPFRACVGAGATILPNLIGNFSMPYLSTDFSPSGAAESWQITSARNTDLFSHATMSPTRVSVEVPIAKTLLVQAASRDIQKLLVRSAMRSISSQIDEYVLSSRRSYQRGDGS